MLKSSVILCLLGWLVSSGAWGANYVFTSPPRETPEEGQELYQPVVNLLSEKTEHEFVYTRADNWLAYQRDMREARYHLIFDDPHFISWRILRMSHTPLVRLSGELKFAVIVRKDDVLSQLSNLSGYLVCANPPPDMGTLLLMSNFKNSLQIPAVRVSLGASQAYRQLLDGTCRGAVMPHAVHLEFDPGGANTKMLYTSEDAPNQAFSADPRINKKLQETLREILLSPEGLQATQNMRERFSGGREMIATDRDDYAGFAYLLEEVIGFQF